MTLVGLGRLIILIYVRSLASTLFSIYIIKIHIICLNIFQISSKFLDSSKPILKNKSNLKLK